MALRPATRYHPHRGHKINTAPTVEPVTADQFRSHIIADADEMPTTEANDWIASARQLIEDTYGIAMISQVWELSLDNWPRGREPWWDGVRQGAISELSGGYVSLELPRYPLISVDTVTTYDTSGTASAVTISSTFDIDTYSTPGRMSLQSGATWPVALRPTNAILIEYTAGYGATAASVPAPLKLAVKQVAAYMYNHRGDGCDPKDALAAGAGVLGRYEVKRV